MADHNPFGVAGSPGRVAIEHWIIRKYGRHVRLAARSLSNKDVIIKRFIMMTTIPEHLDAKGIDVSAQGLNDRHETGLNQQNFDTCVAQNM